MVRAASPSLAVEAVITDPPYNIGKDFEGENMQVQEWVDWCEKWVKECNRVLVAGGAFYITLGWQSIAEFKVMVNKFPELRLRNWIIWYMQDGWKGDNGYGHSKSPNFLWLNTLSNLSNTLFSLTMALAWASICVE